VKRIRIMNILKDKELTDINIQGIVRHFYFSITIARCLQSSNRHLEALKIYDALPRRYDSLYSKSICLREIGQFAAAIKIYEELLEKKDLPEASSQSIRKSIDFCREGRNRASRQPHRNPLLSNARSDQLPIPSEEESQVLTRTSMLGIFGWRWNPYNSENVTKVSKVLIPLNANNDSLPIR
jgi:tetratricopeptide (TPR) repeat protein